MAEARRFVRSALWTVGLLLGGGALFGLVLALDIPYAKTDSPTPPPRVMASSPPAPEPVSPWAVYEAAVIGVRDGQNDRTLLIQAEIPGRSPDCARDPQISDVLEENGTIYANVTFTGLSATHGQAGLCPEKTVVELTLATAAPIGGRTVSLNSLGGKPWNKLPDRTWGHCGALGCNPPADHCAPVRIAQTSGEAVSTNTRACDQNWLVVDRVNFPGAAAIHVVYQWSGEDWKAVTGVQTDGCAEILTKVPQFPVTLCEKIDTPR